MTHKIGAIQPHDIQGDIVASLRVICRAMEQADAEGIDILCFPECFLQGYTLDSKETHERSIDLSSSEFETIMHTLQDYNVTIILGLIEKDDKGFYNTAAVIRQGTVLGTYRKVHLFERNFRPGEAYPTFTGNDLPFGVNICYDARFTEGPTELTAQGAKVIFYPLNNRLPHEKASHYRDMHISNLVARAKENECWVVSSDVVAQDETHTGYGCTSIVDPQGAVVAKAAELSDEMVTMVIPSFRPLGSA